MSQHVRTRLPPCAAVGVRVHSTNLRRPSSARKRRLCPASRVGFARNSRVCSRRMRGGSLWRALLMLGGFLAVAYVAVGLGFGIWLEDWTRRPRAPYGLSSPSVRRFCSAPGFGCRHGSVAQSGRPADLPRRASRRFRAVLDDHRAATRARPRRISSGVDTTSRRWLREAHRWTLKCFRWSETIAPVALVELQRKAPADPGGLSLSPSLRKRHKSQGEPALAPGKQHPWLSCGDDRLQTTPRPCTKFGADRAVCQRLDGESENSLRLVNRSLHKFASDAVEIVVCTVEIA